MQQMPGVAIGIVREVEDPQLRGVFACTSRGSTPTTLPTGSASPVSTAARTRARSSCRDPGDEVLVAFELGNARIPYVVGGLWNPKDPPPATHPRERRLQSKNGHKIRFIDATPKNGDKGALIVEDAHGNRVVMSNGQIRIKSTAEVIIEAPSIVLKGPGYRRVVVPNSNPI